MLRTVGAGLMAVAVTSLGGCFESHHIGEGPGSRADGSVDFDGSGPFPDGGGPLPDGGVPLPDGSVLTECTGTSAPITTPIRTLGIPRRPVGGEAEVGMGHDLDGTREPTCDVYDYENGVDNSFLDVDSTLRIVQPDFPIVLQDAINDSLACVIGDTTCRRLQLGIRVTQGNGCAEVSVLDQDGEVFENPGVGLLDENGNFRVEVPSFPLVFSFPTPNGPADFPLRMRSVVITGRVVGQDIVDVIIGGSLQKGEFEQTVHAVLPYIGFVPPWEEVRALIQPFYDMGNCDELSVGLMANWTGSR